ncbi:hypothetical protein MTO96_030812, partial [Rhipicephalus appendiculatus]
APVANSSSERFYKAALHPDNFYTAKLDRGALLEACKVASAKTSQRPCVMFDEWPGDGTGLSYRLVLFVPDNVFVPERYHLGTLPLMRQMFLDKRALVALNTAMEVRNKLFLLISLAIERETSVGNTVRKCYNMITITAAIGTHGAK